VALTPLDHLVHEILSIIALGASPEDVQRGYEYVVKKLQNREFFRSHAGKRDNYSDFLVFFQREIDSKGVGPVMNEYLFAGDEFADEMLIRLFAGEMLHMAFSTCLEKPVDLMA
jgi:hypothetical protein